MGDFSTLSLLILHRRRFAAATRPDVNSRFNLIEMCRSPPSLRTQSQSTKRTTQENESALRPAWWYVLCLSGRLIIPDLNNGRYSISFPAALYLGRVVISSLIYGSAPAIYATLICISLRSH